MSQDRQLTESEFREFEKQMAKAQEAQAMDDIAELLAFQTKKIKDQQIHIRVLEDLLCTRTEKLAELEKILAALEQEVVKLKWKK